MPKKKPKLIVLSENIVVARRIIDQQQALLEKLRVSGQPTLEVEATLRTYASSLMHLLARERKIREEAMAKKGERLKKKKLLDDPSG